MLAPTFFFIGCLIWLSLYEIRKWVELFIDAAKDSEETPEPMPESVKHMYN
jgi:hypothetical protein